MIRCVRTTIRLDDALLAEAKAEAARTGRTLTRVVEDALRETLARRGSSHGRREPVDIPTFAGNGLQPGVDLDSSAGLLEIMDDRAAG
jgi:Ribbon-helix-helix protein, copG family